MYKSESGNNLYVTDTEISSGGRMAGGQLCVKSGVYEKIIQR